VRIAAGFAGFVESGIVESGFVELVGRRAAAYRAPLRCDETAAGGHRSRRTVLT
jgi:hypothetical protein